MPGAHRAARSSGPGCLQGRTACSGQVARRPGQTQPRCCARDPLSPHHPGGAPGATGGLWLSFGSELGSRVLPAALAAGSAAPSPSPSPLPPFGPTRQEEQGEGHHHDSHLRAEPGGRARRLGEGSPRQSQPSTRAPRPSSRHPEGAPAGCGTVPVWPPPAAGQDAGPIPRPGVLEEPRSRGQPGRASRAGAARALTGALLAPLCCCSSRVSPLLPRGCYLCRRGCSRRR